MVKINKIYRNNSYLKKYEKSSKNICPFDRSPKKAQVTLYVVLAVIIVFSLIIAIFFFMNNSFKSPYSGTEVSPVAIYVESCLNDASKSAVKEIGYLGGYTNYDLGKFMIIPNEPTLSQGVYFPKGSGYFVPYWLHMSSPNACKNSCEFESNVPTLSMIEENMNYIIRQKVMECVEAFSQETLQNDQSFKITPQDMPNVKTVIRKNGIVINLEYPLLLKKLSNNKEYSISSFKTDLDLPLFEIYKTALEISAMQAKYQFFEKRLLDMISVNSGRSTDKLPPFSDLALGFQTPIYWQSSDVKEKISKLFLQYNSVFQLNGSKNQRDIIGKTRLDDLYFKGFVLDIPDKVGLDELDYNIFYDPSWNSYASFGGEYLIGPRTINFGNVKYLNLIPYVSAFSMYATPYDLSYPLVVSLRNENALGGEGFTFNFAMELNVRNSEPLTPDSNFFDLQSKESMFCQESNVQSGDYTINVVDENNNPIFDAELYFSSGGESCPLGNTGKNGYLETKLPSALGFITAHKEGYFSKDAFVLVEPDSSENVVVNLYKISTIKLSVKKINYDGNEINTFPQPLSNDDFAYVSLERIPEFGESEFISFATINGSVQGFENVTLVPGSYRVSGYIINFKKNVVPEKNICIGLEPVCVSEIVLPEIEMNTTMTGQIELNENSAVFEYFPKTITKDTMIEVYMLDIGLIDSYDKLELLGMTGELSRKYSNDLIPKIRG
ncbi:MAG TPA: hypothetical protein PLX15_03820 [Candidatus Woesearchaeota archaeon]|nr:hypothetical protein [Candidatus Woesearchaeota archaeon]